MRPSNRPTPPAGAQAILRAIRLLKSFSAERPELSLVELQKATKLTKPTAHRLLTALESEGLVARVGSEGRFHLGPALIALGSQAMLSSDLREALRPTLEAVAKATGEATTLEIWVDDYMLILDGVSGTHLLTSNLEIGSRWPIHATSTGKCLLADMSGEQLSAVLGTTFTGFTEHTVTTPEELEEQLALVRKRGFATAIEELELDFVAVGSGFKDAFGNFEGAISIGGPVSRFKGERMEEIGELLRAAADRLSKRHRTTQAESTKGA